MVSSRFFHIIGKSFVFSYDTKILCTRARMENVAAQPCPAR